MKPKPLKKYKSYANINPFNLYRMIDGKTYQFLGVYPLNDSLKLDLERLHYKYGYMLKFENYKDNEMKVWRRQKKSADQRFFVNKKYKSLGINK